MENWKPIKGWEDYYLISNFGKIKRLKRITIFKDGRKRIFKEKEFQGFKNQSGYIYFTLRKNEQKERFFIHRLVAIHFIENPMNHCCINHIDGNPSNNHISNLEWCNHEYNQYHAMKTGLFKPHTQKLNFEIANQIRLEYNKKEFNQRQLGEKYGLNRSNINKILKNKCWKDYGYTIIERSI